MTDPATLLSLAERCEQAAGPDRELDNAILIALGYSWRGMAYLHDDDNHVLKGSTFFTKILDAAVTLVPEGCGWMVMKNVAKVGRWPKRGATPALALCAAALRARAAAYE